MELKLLYSYEDWLAFQNGKDVVEIERVKGNIASNELAVKCQKKEHLTGEELKNFVQTKKELDIKHRNLEYTDLSHKITFLCQNPSNGVIDYEEVGKCQCRIEQLKSPISIPNDIFLLGYEELKHKLKELVRIYALSNSYSSIKVDISVEKDENFSSEKTRIEIQTKSEY